MSQLQIFKLFGDRRQSRNKRCVQCFRRARKKGAAVCPVCYHRNSKLMLKMFGG